MPEKYEVKLPGGLAVSAQDPKLAHRVADALLMPVQALAGLTSTAIRVLEMPLRLVEAKGERLLETVRAASNQVPPERQIEPSPSIAGPILEGVKYLEPGNPLLSMYENLLARAMDQKRVGEAHPAFAKVIEQLSPDEARLLFEIRSRPIVRTYHRISSSMAAHAGIDRQLAMDDTPRDCLIFPENADMYLDHLKSLSLIHEANDERSVAIVSHVVLTEFGGLFAKACIPKTWTWAEPDRSSE